MAAPPTSSLDPTERQALKYLLDGIQAELGKISGKQDQILEMHRTFAGRLLKIYERQRQDRARIDRLERTVYQGSGAPLARPNTPVMAFTPGGIPAVPPPPPSIDDSAVHDIADLRAELAALKPEVERARRRESWAYRKNRSVIFGIAAALAIAAISAAATWLASHIRVGTETPTHSRATLVRR